MSVETVPPRRREMHANSALWADYQTPPVSDGTPWWLWPHLLSLDAPLVAVVWQWWWGRFSHARLAWCHPCVLGLSVWLIYLADRLADGSRAVPGEPIVLRHAFHARRRPVLSILVLLVAASLSLLSLGALPRNDFLAGLSFLSLAVAYFGLIHGSRQQSWTSFVPKEAVVGVLFAVGTMFFPACREVAPSRTVILGVALFGLLCFCNCALITSWEKQAQDLRNPRSLLNAFPRLAVRLRAVCVGLAFLAGAGAFGTGSLLFLPLAASGLVLAILDHYRARLSANALRVLVDAALLTPWLASVLLRG